MKSNKRKLMFVILVLTSAILACSLPSLRGNISFSPNEVEEQEEKENIVTAEPIEELPPYTLVIPDEVLLQNHLTNLYETVSPGVVSIQVYSELGSGIGSGFVIDQEGYIATNYHVVENAQDVEVHFKSGLKVFGEVAGVDLDSDLAIIKVDVDPTELHVLQLGDSNQLRVGQTVVAIGNPFGLSGTMTVGIVSARGRTLESIRQTESGTFFSAGDLIQTDATINPGNSGGPLLNLNGEVIGINRALQTGAGSVLGSSSNTGIGFAVSSNILKLVAPTLKKGEVYNYPYLGLSSLPNLTLSQAEFLGLSRTTGAYIVEIVSGGPADEAGLQAGSQPTSVAGLYAGGDLIIKVDQLEILEFSDLLSYMMLNKKPGDSMDFTVLRNGEEEVKTVILGERPSR